MNLGSGINLIIDLLIFVYMLGIGFQFLPDPGKNNPVTNKSRFDSYRNVFKIGGIAGILYVVISFLSN